MPNIQYKTDLLGKNAKIFFFIMVLFGVLMSSHSVLAALVTNGNCSLVTAADCHYFSALATCTGSCITDKAISLCGAKDYASNCLNRCTGTAQPHVAACVPRATTTVPAICKDTTKRTYSCVTPPPVGYTLDATCNKACNGANDKYSYKAVAGNTDTGGNGGTCSDPNYVKISGVCFPKDTGLPDPKGGILEVLGNFLGWLLAIFGFLSIGAFVVSGIQYLIAAGDDKMIETAKRNMKWSVVGVLVGLSGWIIMMAVARALSASPLF